MLSSVDRPLPGVESDDAAMRWTMLETFVGSELLKHTAFASERIDLMHYRDDRGAEVDWVLEDARGRVVGIEVKATSSPSSRDFKGLRAFAGTVGQRFHRGVLLHIGQTAAPMGEGLWALPIDSLWRLTP